MKQHWWPSENISFYGDDLLALIASFSGRLYGMRSHKQQAERKKAFELVAPILSDGLIRPKTENRSVACMLQGKQK